MKQVFRAHQLCQQDGPLGPYIDSYEAEMRSEGYAQPTREVQVRLVADFSCSLAKRGTSAQSRTSPPNCSGHTFAREPGADVRQETINPLCSDYWSC
jgi:hypothetical protein